MCNCPIETRFDDNEFVRTYEAIQEDSTLEIKVTFCPLCQMENERIIHEYVNQYELREQINKEVLSE